MKIPHDNANNAARGGCDCLPRPPAAAAPVLITFVLRYEDAWFGMEKRVAFEAEDAAAALAMMDREPIGRWAELSRDDQVICRRGHEPGGAVDYWVAD